MLNNHIGKRVSLLVASNSGASTISCEQRYCNGVVTSVMNFYGIIKNADDKFIELGDTKYTLYNLDVEKPLALNYPIRIETSIFESELMLVNIDNVVAISLI